MVPMSQFLLVKKCSHINKEFLDADMVNKLNAISILLNVHTCGLEKDFLKSIEESLTQLCPEVML